jgi:hypothetical protein
MAREACSSSGGGRLILQKQLITDSPQLELVSYGQQDGISGTPERVNFFFFWMSY